jgi:hypothetical protein
MKTTALIMGKETIACTNGIAKKAEYHESSTTYIKHLGGRIPKIMKSLVLRLLFAISSQT